MKKQVLIFILVIGLLVSLLMTLVTGPVEISVLTVVKILISEVFDITETWPDHLSNIILNVRLPRILLGIVAGCALSVSGCSMQALFRNPMASPYVCGVASGGAFGAALVIILHLSRSLIMPVAFFFSLLTIFVVYHIAKTGSRVSGETLLLSGIALSLFFSAATSFLQYMAEENDLRQIIFWLMGGFWASSWWKVKIVLPVIIAGTACLMFFYKEMNILLLGEDQARDLGVNVEKTRKIILVMSAIVTAGAVASCGVIGFVGLIIPHVMRIFIGPDHKYLLPASCLGGSIFLIWIDTFARTLVFPTEVPVGIITGMVGVPFFLLLLRKRKKVSGF
ncbi:MAG: iron chelate uptake ABC transporter family permease subunit [Desulfobacteraceae bacterium]|jgi:iron complex transport system permease protein